ncbi:MAG: nucleoside deaminase [Firmicutes bacterium]|nr:nucleoside deaminase [Bacillota bacterium]
MNYFNNLEKPYQIAFELAWQSFNENIFPIGAVIVDKEGNVISSGRNLVQDNKNLSILSETNMAHAEMIAMSHLKKSQHKNIREYKLYSTMEPCPMCFGTIVMMNIMNINYACKDEYCGAVTLKDSIPYIKQRNMKFNHTGGYEEVFQLVIQTLFECINYSKDSVVLQSLRNTNEAAISLAIHLFESEFLTNFQQNASVSYIYNEVIKKYIEFS